MLAARYQEEIDEVREWMQHDLLERVGCRGLIAGSKARAGMAAVFT